MGNKFKDNIININFKKKTLLNKSIKKDSNNNLSGLHCNLDKLNKFKIGLDQGFVSVAFSLSYKGLIVPNNFYNEDFLSLKFSNNFDMNDLIFNKDYISSTLMFHDGYFFCITANTDNN